MITPKDICFVVGTAGTPCYVHMNVALIKRFHPNATVFIINDKYQDKDTAKIANLYSDCYYIETGYKDTDIIANRHSSGENKIFEKAIKLAHIYGFKYLVKLSRRMMVNTEILNNLCGIINKSDGLTISNITHNSILDDKGEIKEIRFFLPIRTEIVCLNVDAWLNGVPELLRNSDYTTKTTYMGMHTDPYYEVRFAQVTEYIYNNFASDKLKGYYECQKQYESKLFCPGLTKWSNLVLDNRYIENPGLISHFVYTPEAFYSGSQQLGLPYNIIDFLL